MGQSWSLRVITPPAFEPVTLDEAKAHLRVEITDDDDLISRLITAAREDAEEWQGRAYITQTLRLTLDRFPWGDGPIWLPRPPVQSVTQIAYVDSAGVQQIVDPSIYRVDTAHEPARIVPDTDQSWPDDELAPVAAVTVDYVAGYGDVGADVPAAIRQAILLILGHLYENREDVVIGRSVIRIPMASQHLLAKGRVWLPEQR